MSTLKGLSFPKIIILSPRSTKKGSATSSFHHRIQLLFKLWKRVQIIMPRTLDRHKFIAVLQQGPKPQRIPIRDGPVPAAMKDRDGRRDVRQIGISGKMIVQHPAPRI